MAQRCVALTVALLAVMAASASVASAANNAGTGDTGFFTFPVASPDGSVKVNVASGNLLIDALDLADADATYHVTLERYYNSLAPNTDGILGPRWTLHVDPKVQVVDQGSSAVIAGPSGYRVTATKDAGGNYVLPTDFDGRLTKTGSGWALKRTTEGDVFRFDGSGTLTGTTDSEGRQFTVQATSAAGKTVLSSYGDQNGRRLNVSYTGDSHVREIDDPASGHHMYGYTGGRLTSKTGPGGGQGTYGYDSAGYLNRVEQPSGDVVTTTNDSQGRATSFTVTPSGGGAQTTTFDYSVAGQTTVTFPGGSRRIYQYDDSWRVTGSGAGSGQYYVGSEGGDATYGPDWSGIAAGIDPQSGNVLVHEPAGNAANADADPPLGFDRWYRSESQARTSLGTAWSTSFSPDVRLTFPSSSTATLALPSRRPVTFTASGAGGGYSSSVPSFSVVRSGENWRVTDEEEGRDYTFDGAGVLVTIENEDPAQSVGASYSATPHRLASVTNNLGTVTPVSYGAAATNEGLVSAAGDQNFVYARSLLRSVGAAGGATSDYQYGAGRRLTAINRSGYALSITYDSAGRATSLAETDSEGLSTVHVTYKAPEAGRCDVALDASQTDVTTDDGHVVSFCVDAAGAVRRIVGGSDPTSDIHDDVDITDHEVADDGYGTEESVGFCPSDDTGADSCNRNALDNEVTQAILAEGNDEVDAPEDGDGGALSRAAATAKIAGSLEKGGAGWGFANELPNIFNEEPYKSAFDGLGVKRLRVSLPWDVVLRAKRSTRVTVLPKFKTIKLAPDARSFKRAVDVIEGADAAGVEVMVTFNKSSGSKGSVVLPSEARYKAAVVAFHQRFPSVKLLGSWNEMNFAGHQPFGHQAERAGARWKVLNDYCNRAAKKCTAVAGDFLDSTKEDPGHAGTEDIAQYLRDFKRGAGYVRTKPPAVWALHAYSAGARRSLATVRAFARATACTGCSYTPKIWLTEQGGRYDNRDQTGDEALGDGDTRFLINKTPTASPRITRFYYYQMGGDGGFDTGLLAYNRGLAARSTYAYFKGFTNP